MSSHVTRLFVAVLPLILGCNHLGGSRSNRTTFADDRGESRTPSRFADRRSDREDDQRSLNQVVVRAKEAASKRRFDVARSLYGQVIAAEPDHAAAHHGLAVIADSEGDFLAAEEHYRVALKGQPRNPDLLNDVGYSFLQQKRFSEAERFLRRSVEIDPNNVLATSNLGHTLAQRGQLEEALALFRRVGTESQAQEEIAKYTGNPRNPFARDPRPAPGADAPPTDDGEWANLSPDEMRTMMERARLDAIAERRERDRVDVGAIRALDRGEFRPEPTRTAPGPDQPIAWSPGERWPNGDASRAMEPSPPAGAPARSSEPSFVRFEDDPGPRPATPDDRWSLDPPAARAEPALAVSPPMNRAPSGDDLWPADPGSFDGPPQGTPSNGITQVGFDDGRDQWPTVSPRSPAATDPRGAAPLREDWGAEPRAAVPGGAPLNAGRPLDADSSRRRAAMLGLGAGGAIPLTIEPRNAPTPRATTPPATGDGGLGFEDWPATGAEEASVQPIPTTSPVASDPSLYRSANGTMHGAARPQYGESAADTIRRQREEIERQRMALDRLTAERRAANGQLEADRRAFQGGGAPHPGFPADFGPVTHTPQPRGATEHRTNW